MKLKVPLIIFPIYLAVLSLSVWIFSPIYPDEVAMHISLGRYHQDSGLLAGLYQLCTSNYRLVNYFFLLPASIISLLDLHLLFIGFRYISFLVPILLIILTVYINLKSSKFYNLSSLIGFIGIAGSGLILARYELFQLINIFVCVLSYVYLMRYKNEKIYDLTLLLLLTISALFSIYAHIQGLLFLPLTFYCFFRIFCAFVKPKISLMISLILLFLFIYYGIKFQNFNCQEYPEITSFVKKMGTNISDISSFYFFESLITKFDIYISSFLYLQSFPANYIPDIPIDSLEKFTIINFLISSLVLINILISILIVLFFTYNIVNIFSVKKNNLPSEILFYQHISFLLISPAILLLLYDPILNFYRVIFINFILGIGISIFFSRITLPIIISYVVKIYWAILGGVILICSIVNFSLFTSKFLPPVSFTGPSVSIFTDWSRLNEDINHLAAQCGVDLSRGGVVVDDLTYSGLKKFPSIYPITYLALQAEILSVPSDVVVAKLKPNFVLARCGYMEGTKIGLPFTAKSGELCCRNFVMEK
jgi:hypothetical protein